MVHRCSVWHRMSQQVGVGCGVYNSAYGGAVKNCRCATAASWSVLRNCSLVIRSRLWLFAKSFLTLCNATSNLRKALRREVMSSWIGSSTGRPRHLLNTYLTRVLSEEIPHIAATHNARMHAPENVGKTVWFLSWSSCGRITTNTGQKSTQPAALKTINAHVNAVLCRTGLWNASLTLCR